MPLVKVQQGLMDVSSPKMVSLLVHGQRVKKNEAAPVQGGIWPEIIGNFGMGLSTQHNSDSLIVNWPVVVVRNIVRKLWRDSIDNRNS